MALQKTRKLKQSSIDIKDAYCRIRVLRFEHPSSVWVEVGVYESEEGVMLDSTTYQFSVDDFGDKDSITAASSYALLKAKEEWADATEV